jgi:hypothetical protein
LSPEEFHRLKVDYARENHLRNSVVRESVSMIETNRMLCQTRHIFLVLRVEYCDRQCKLRNVNKRFHFVYILNCHICIEIWYAINCISTRYLWLAFSSSSKPPYRFSKVVSFWIFLLIQLGLGLELGLRLGRHIWTIIINGLLLKTNHLAARRLNYMIFTITMLY